jgi:hypothetical protein
MLRGKNFPDIQARCQQGVNQVNRPNLGSRIGHHPDPLTPDQWEIVIRTRCTAHDSATL